VDGGLNENGKRVQTYNNNGNNAQKWRIIQNYDGTYRIMPIISSTRALEVKSKSTGNNATIQIYDYSAGNHQKWVFEEARYGSAWGFRDLGSGVPNCFGYALNLTYSPPLLMNRGDSVETVASRVENYVRNTLGRSIRRISGPTDAISPQEYRFCMRVGNYTDSHDYHFWVQTSTGSWSEKNGEYKVFRQPFYENPSTANWNQPKVNVFGVKIGENINYYNSTTIYFASTR